MSLSIRQLETAIEYLQDVHNINIRFHPTVESDEQIIVADEKVEDFNLAGIKLKHALKLILDKWELTYIIESEVLMIVSKTLAQTKRTTRVYPVGDLVIPISSPLAGGLGQGFGGTGGFQGQGGLGQGGQFGQGGAGFGGNQNGGGGVFMIPPEAVKPQQAKMNANQKSKKKFIKKANLDDDVQGVLDNILNKETTQIPRFQGQAFAQIKDPQFEKPFRLDNDTIRNLKKKR